MCSEALLGHWQAVQLGRHGGRISGARRKGDSALGRHMAGLRGAKAQASCWPGLKKKWARNANLSRYGLPLEPLPVVTISQRAVAQRGTFSITRGNTVERPNIGPLIRNAIVPNFVAIA